jgi:hypothetical protein
MGKGWTRIMDVYDGLFDEDLRVSFFINEMTLMEVDVSKLCPKIKINY